MEDHLLRTISEYSETAREYESRVANLHHRIEGLLFSDLIPQGGKILDAGCGDGRDCKIFSDRGFKVTGIDLTPEFLLMASHKVPAANFYPMDMRQLSFEDNYFDGVWSCASIVHMDGSGVAQFLKEAKRVLKPNGVLYLAAKEGPKPVVYGPKTFFFYNERDISSFISDSGLRPLKITSENKLIVDGKLHSEVRAFAIKFFG